ncbi:MAG TPA: preprotein translocase subunit SecG [Rhizomicrobium sp.]|jgi:preprotein translocase subunit SecG|nr:preprotein translocase subunit SecG [Rhizomicrobium sp.]
MQSILIVIQIIVSVALVVTVLLQPSEGGALGIGGGGGGGGGMGGFFSPRGAANTLSRVTAVLAALFFLTSMGLTLTALRGKPQPASILDSLPTQSAPATQTPTPAKQAPAPAPKQDAPSVPTPH